MCAIGLRIEPGTSYLLRNCSVIGLHLQLLHVVYVSSSGVGSCDEFHCVCEKIAVYRFWNLLKVTQLRVRSRIWITLSPRLPVSALPGWYTVIHGCSTNVCLPHLSESMASERNRTGNIAPRKSEIYMHSGHVLGYGYCHRPGSMSLLSNTGAGDLMVCFLCVLLTQKLGDFLKIAICKISHF